MRSTISYMGIGYVREGFADLSSSRDDDKKEIMRGDLMSISSSA